MTKSELKTGMIVTTGDGNEYLVLRDVDFGYLSSSGYNYKDGILVSIYFETSWNGLKYYNEDLTYNQGVCRPRDWNIVKVETLDHPVDIFRPNKLKDKSLRKLLWERKEIKEVTMAEVEEMFGCKVKIVNPD